MTFTPAELAAAIREHVPAFDVQYLPDFREGIARSWPVSINDSCARRDWGWQPTYDLRARTSHFAILALPYPTYPGMLPSFRTNDLKRGSY